MASKKISLYQAVIVATCSMVGAGIFTIPAKFARSVGPAGILSYFISLLLIIPVALALAKIAQQYPEGSFFAYAKSWGGKVSGLLASGFYLLGITVALGLVTKVFSSQLIQIFNLPSPFYIICALTTLTVALIISIPWLRSKISHIGGILLACTFFALISTTLICLYGTNLSNLTPFAPHGYKAIINAIPLILFAFFGFESATTLFNDVENPAKNIPRAMILSLLSVATIYFFFIFSCILCIPANLLSSDTSSLALALGEKFPNLLILTKLIALATITSFFGVLIGLSYAICNMYQLFFKIILEKSPYKLNINHCVFLLSIIVLSIALIFKSLDLFFNLASVLIICSFGMSIFGLCLNKSTFLSGLLGIICSALIFMTALFGFIQEFLKLI